MDTFKIFIDEPTILAHGKLNNGDNWAIQKLIYHVALYINPESDGSNIWHDERYCYINQATATAAVDHFDESGEWLWFQKIHHLNQSVNGRYLYQSGILQLPEYAIRELPFDLEDVKKGVLIHE